MAEFESQKPSMEEREEEEDVAGEDEEEDDEEEDQDEEEEHEDEKPAAAAAVSYPIKVVYCGICGLPPEYCSFGDTEKECKEWAEANCPDELAISKAMADMSVAAPAAGAAAAAGEGGEGEEADDKGKKKKKKKAGGKKAAEGETKQGVTKVWIARVNRNKRKFVTVVGGMETVPGVKLKDAAKAMGRHFACGASVNKHVAAGGAPAEEIIVQGDVVMDLPDWLEATYGIGADKIFLQS